MWHAYLEVAAALPAMAALLCFSFLFSSSETSIFALSRHQLKEIGRRWPRAGEDLAYLRANPDAFLMTVLLCNLTVNLSYFGLNTATLIHVSERIGQSAAVGLALVSLLLLIVLGEVTPKGVALVHTVLLARCCGRVMAPVVRAIRPLRVVMESVSFSLVSLWERMAQTLGAPTPAEAAQTTPDELHFLLEASRLHGAIGQGERDMMAEVIRLREVKLREIMTPRVDMVCHNLGDSSEKLKQLILSTRRTKILVYDGKIDNIRGVIYSRDILLHPARPLGPFIRPVVFVPDSKKAEQMLREFETGLRLAVVVDEYGGVSGLVTPEDILESVMGEISDEFSEEPDEPITPVPGGYRLSGSLSVRDWCEFFHMPLAEGEVSTLGGLMALKLQRVPQPCDELVLDRYRLRVEKMHKHRVISILLLEVEPQVAPEGGQASPALEPPVLAEPTPPANTETEGESLPNGTGTMGDARTQAHAPDEEQMP